MSNLIQSKKCSHCKQIKPISDFCKDRHRKDGHRYQCKKCRQEYQQKYNLVHRAERLQYSKEYDQAHRAEHSQHDKEYRDTIQGHLRLVWSNMRQRCNNPKHKQYKNWGGRGIKVKFAYFDDFFDYIKELKIDPRGLTIDRIDNDGHYEPGNIRFVTIRENCQNRRHKIQREAGVS